MAEMEVLIAVTVRWRRLESDEKDLARLLNP